MDFFDRKLYFVPIMQSYSTIIPLQSLFNNTLFKLCCTTVNNQHNINLIKFKVYNQSLTGLKDQRMTINKIKTLRTKGEDGVTSQKKGLKQPAISSLYFSLVITMQCTNYLSKSLFPRFQESIFVQEFYFSQDCMFWKENNIVDYSPIFMSHFQVLLILLIHNG